MKYFFRFDTQAFVQQKNPKNCKITHEQVAMDFKKHHLKKVTLKSFQNDDCQIFSQGASPFPRLKMKKPWEAIIARWMLQKLRTENDFSPSLTKPFTSNLLL